MAQAQNGYSFGTTLDLPLDAAIERVTAALKAEGFGVLTTIDVRATLQQKLGVEFEPYVILGACNPRLAHQALQQVHDVGLLLPCNVIVHAHGSGSAVDIADPVAMLSVAQQPALQPVAAEARTRLLRVIAQLDAPA